MKIWRDNDTDKAGNQSRKTVVPQWNGNMANQML
jgi:hypothetical protein